MNIFSCFCPLQAIRLCFFHHCVIPNGMQPIFHPFLATAGESQVSVSAASLPVTIISNPESVSVQENIPYVMTPPMLPIFPLFPKDEMGPVPVPLPLFPETPSSGTFGILKGKQDMDMD